MWRQDYQQPGAFIVIVIVWGPLKQGWKGVLTASLSLFYLHEAWLYWGADLRGASSMTMHDSSAL